MKVVSTGLELAQAANEMKELLGDFCQELALKIAQIDKEAATTMPAVIHERLAGRFLDKKDISSIIEILRMNQVLPTDNMQFNNELLAPSSVFVGGFGGEVASSSELKKFEFEDLKQEKKSTGKNIEEIDFGLYQRHREAIIKVARDIGKLQAQDYSKERHELAEELAGKVTDRTMGIIRHSIIAPVMMPAVSFSTEVLTKHLMELGSRGKLTGVAAGDSFELEEDKGKEDKEDIEQKAQLQIEEKLNKIPENLNTKDELALKQIRLIIDEEYKDLPQQVRVKLTIQAFNLSNILKQNPFVLYDGLKTSMALSIMPPPIFGTNEITTDVPMETGSSAIGRAVDEVVNYYKSDDKTRFFILAQKTGIIDVVVDQVLEKKPYEISKNSKKSQFKDSVFLPNPNFEPEDDNERKINCNKAESHVWKELQKYKNGYRTNNQTGKLREYYKWDHTHNDIEVFDHNYYHKGSLDPRTGNLYKEAVKGRRAWDLM